jgi:uncharacterized protein YbjT (DUF2867 family)
VTPLKVLVCGASGFLGRAICTRLSRAGHQVIRGVRQARRPDDMAIDFRTDTTVDHWRGRLDGIQVVVNAVGIIAETRDSPFDALHHRGPAALFAACVEAGVARSSRSRPWAPTPAPPPTSAASTPPTRP